MSESQLTTGVPKPSTAFEPHFKHHPVFFRQALILLLCAGAGIYEIHESIKKILEHPVPATVLLETYAELI